MLFKKKFLELIEAKQVKTAFRRWTRPTVKANGTLLTPAGQLRILSLEKIGYEQISDREIREAGYQGRSELDKELNAKSSGAIYRIRFELEREDPRIELRENRNLPEGEMKELTGKLDRLDSGGRVKGWTYKVLEAVCREPGKRAADYAAQLGYEKEWFKLNIRKLKNLGLTISLTNGYKISPRGEAFLKKRKRTPGKYISTKYLATEAKWGRCVLSKTRHCTTEF